MNDLANIFGQGFDTHSVEPQADFDVLPPGKYPVLIEQAEVKPTKAGTGHYLELQMVVLDGPAKNRKLWDRINIQNPSTPCTEIGLRQLAALGQALGIQAITDSSQLLNKSCVASVKVKNDQNEIRTYKAFEDAQSVQPPTAPQQPAPPVNYPPTPAQMQASLATAQPSPPPGGSAKPPWAR
jgi:hypothetical protein